ncbi:MAG TPA: hypothetical protein VFF53_03480 [Geobacteraceae bacterium]|nr:hypothetical protein [Aquabacterium sp.]HZV81211.1 hypothetical protein [Geobacteraceae bacterium]
MSRLPAWLRRLAAVAVVTFLVTVLFPAAFLWETGERVVDGLKAALSTLVGWFRPWRWRERHKRLRAFRREVRGYVDRLDRRWEPKR